jgi:predicted nucleic acid-binding protein
MNEDIRNTVRERYGRAAAVKATCALSLADAWIAAAALELDATLIHKDPEFGDVAGLRQERLPQH